MNAGAQSAPGDVPGTLTSAEASRCFRCELDYELDTPLDSDLVLMSSGVLTLGGQQFSDFNFTPLGGFVPGSYTLIDAGSINGTLGNTLSGPIGNGLTGTLAIQGNDLVLSVVPEPGTLALLGGCGSALVLTARLRREAGKVRKVAAARELWLPSPRSTGGKGARIGLARWHSAMRKKSKPETVRI